MKKYTLLILVLLGISCSSKDDCSTPYDASRSNIDLEYTDLTHTIYQVETEEELSNFLNQHPVIRDQFFEFGNITPLYAFGNEVLKLVQTPKVKALFSLNSFQSFENTLEQNRDIREFLTYEYLNTNPSKSLKDIYNLFSNSSIQTITKVENVLAYFDNHPNEKVYFETIFAYKDAETLLKENFNLLQNPYFDSLYQETNNLMNSGEIAYDLGLAFNRLRAYYPEFETPEVKMVYSGFGKDIFLSDSLLVIGLDYYLGPDAKYRPNVYDYIKSRLTPDHLVPQLLQFTSLKFNKTKPNRRNVLDEMIFYGKAMEFAKEMLPCTADSLIIGYKNQELANVTVSEAVIWSHFLEKKLLYNDNTRLISRYIEERPNIPEIDRRCPGRIGQWLGWQIVRAYREETGVSFTELMEETDAQKILTQSKYRPRLGG